MRRGGSSALLSAAALAVLVVVGCQPSFDPPETPAHDDQRGGALHAALAERPFRCPTGEAAPAPVPGRRGDREVPNTSCAVTSTRPPDRLLSCDAIGCHGGYDYRADPLTAARHLRGSNGPSCYTCHGELWRDDR